MQYTEEDMACQSHAYTVTQSTTPVFEIHVSLKQAINITDNYILNTLFRRRRH